MDTKREINNATTDLGKIIQERYDRSDNYLAPKREMWTEHENLLHNQLADQISQMTKAQVFDPVLSTLSMYRSFRVMAQLATGKVRAISKNDEGGEKLMNLTLDKYVIPNANAQFPFLTKMRMVDMYSDVYGAIGVLCDWDIKHNGYIGPDMWLIAMRDLFPQVGAMSMEDSDHVIVQSWQPVSYFEWLAEKNKENKLGYKNLQEIIDILKDKPGDKDVKDPKLQSGRELTAMGTPTAAKGKGFFRVLSMYERDRWVDCVPSAQWKEFRDTKNKHDNGELPVAIKYSFPLMDDPFGMGGYERGKTMQLANNSLWNMYMDACKISIFPPVLFNKEAIAEKGSIKWSAAAKWMMKGNPAAAAQVLNLTPQGISTFNNTRNAVKASLLNMFGTTDTTVTQEQDQGFGRTPDALKMQASRENTGDNVDRYFMEEFTTKVYRKFINLMSIKMDKVQIRMFKDEIDEFSRQFPDMKGMYDEKTGKLTVDKKKAGSVIYDYEIVPGSTYAVDQQKQQENLLSLFTSLSKNLQIDQATGKPTSPLLVAMQLEGKEVRFGEMFTRIIANSGIQDWDKIVVDTKNSQNHEQVLGDAAAKFAQALEMLKNGGAGGGGIPPTPGNPGQVPQAPGMPVANGGMPPQLPNGMGGGLNG